MESEKPVTGDFIEIMSTLDTIYNDKFSRLEERVNVIINDLLERCNQSKFRWFGILYEKGERETHAFFVMSFTCNHCQENHYYQRGFGYNLPPMGLWGSIVEICRQKIYYNRKCSFLDSTLEKISDIRRIEFETTVKGNFTFYAPCSVPQTEFPILNHY